MMLKYVSDALHIARVNRCAFFCLCRLCLLWVSGSIRSDIRKDGATALSVSGFALGVRISSAFSVALMGYKSKTISANY